MTHTDKMAHRPVGFASGKNESLLLLLATLTPLPLHSTMHGVAKVGPQSRALALQQGGRRRRGRHSDTRCGRC